MYLKTGIHNLAWYTLTQGTDSARYIFNNKQLIGLKAPLPLYLGFARERVKRHFPISSVSRRNTTVLWAGNMLPVSYRLSMPDTDRFSEPSQFTKHALTYNASI